ncbi:ribosomal L1 domain-containing protein 1-like isoform X1 [Acropora palmata]|uniref:ribosomal L1 domain-containing protein 1-like isoform X1 n=1 Tax=Acropora palmata TaxID=6131 RepID=UPI003DA0A389
MQCCGCISSISPRSLDGYLLFSIFRCLPHSLYSDKVEVCLFTKDTNYSEVKKMLKENDVPVNKVISFNKLKKKYQSFEAKRNLCTLCDVFTCDEAIYHLLPQVLGKTFFSRKKVSSPNLFKQNQHKTANG